MKIFWLAVELVPTTSAIVRSKVRYLEAQKANVNAGHFVEMQQALGMTYHPMSILLDRSLDDIYGSMQDIHP